MNKQTIVDEIVKEISVKVREIIREEFDIETRRFRKKLLREVNELLTEQRKPVAVVKKPLIKPPVRRVAQFIDEEQEQPRLMPRRPKITTGDPTVDELLQETVITEDDADMLAGTGNSSSRPSLQRMTFNNERDEADPIQEAVRLIEQSKSSSGLKKFDGDFNPMQHDPSMMDWSNIVERVEEHAKKSSGPA